jgi:hypothetical protein
VASLRQPTYGNGYNWDDAGAQARDDDDDDDDKESQ